jgi:hypothetical protein
MGWLSNFVSNPVGTLTDTISNVGSAIGDTVDSALHGDIGSIAAIVAAAYGAYNLSTLNAAVAEGLVSSADAAAATSGAASGGVDYGLASTGGYGAGGITGMGGPIDYSLAGGSAGAAGLGGTSAMLGGAGAGAGAGVAAGLGSISNYLTPAAILGSGLLGAGAAQSAAGTQAAAQDRANALNYSMYLQGRQDLAPYAGAGLTAQNKLLTYLGLPGGTQGDAFGRYVGDFSSADFLANKDPGYGFRFSEGLKGLDRSAAARGGLLSGATLKGAERFGQDLASTEYQNAFNRYQTNRSNALSPLIGLATAGQNAAAGQGSLAAGYGASGAAGQTALGNIGAAGTMGGVNALSGALGQYLNYSSNADLANSIRTSAYGRPSIPA